MRMLSAASFSLLTCLYAYCQKADLQVNHIIGGQISSKPHVMNLSDGDKPTNRAWTYNSTNKSGANTAKVYKHTAGDLTRLESNLTRLEFEDSKAEMDAYISKEVKLECLLKTAQEWGQHSTIACLHPHKT